MIYLLVLLALLGCMALLDARFELFFWDRPRPAAIVLVAGLVFFLAWDLVAIDAGIFLHGETSLMTGVMLSDQLPLEEAFFLVFLSYQTMILFTGILKWLRYRATVNQP